MVSPSPAGTTLSSYSGQHGQRPRSRSQPHVSQHHTSERPGQSHPPEYRTLSELILLSSKGTHSPDYRMVPHAAPRPKAPRSTQLLPTPEVQAGPPGRSTIITTSSGAQGTTSTHTAGRSPQPQVAPQPAPSNGPGRGHSHQLAKAAGCTNAASPDLITGGAGRSGDRGLHSL